MSDPTTFHLRQSDGESSRLRCHAHHRRGHLGLRPKTPTSAARCLTRAVELGVNFIDTADSYGPYISEELIREALHPYGDVKIATKAGFLRTGPNAWRECGRPEYLRQECEMSLRRLGQESIDLFQLHRIDPTVPADEQFGLLRELLDEGKVQAVGLSEVSVEQIVAARARSYDLDRPEPLQRDEPQERGGLEYCQHEGIGFIPWYPVAAGNLARSGGPLDALAHEERRERRSTLVGVALAPLAGDDADTWHVQGRPRRRELRGGRRSNLDDETFHALDALHDLGGTLDLFDE